MTKSESHTLRTRKLTAQAIGARSPATSTREGLSARNSPLWRRRSTRPTCRKKRALEVRKLRSSRPKLIILRLPSSPPWRNRVHVRAARTPLGHASHNLPLRPIVRARARGHLPTVGSKQTRRATLRSQPVQRTPRSACHRAIAGQPRKLPRPPRQTATRRSPPRDTSLGPRRGPQRRGRGQQMRERS